MVVIFTQTNEKYLQKDRNFNVDSMEIISNVIDELSEILAAYRN